VRHRTFAAKANHDQCRQEDGDPAKGDLNKRQIFRLQAQTEQGLKKFQNSFIDKDCIAAENPCRAHGDSQRRLVQKHRMMPILLCHTCATNRRVA
jgi:hypothetical protein